MHIRLTLYWLKSGLESMPCNYYVHKCRIVYVFYDWSHVITATFWHKTPYPNLMLNYLSLTKLPITSPQKITTVHSRISTLNLPADLDPIASTWRASLTLGSLAPFVHLLLPGLLQQLRVEHIPTLTGEMVGLASPRQRPFSILD
jgi:hypothetical protein